MATEPRSKGWWSALAHAWALIQNSIAPSGERQPAPAQDEPVWPVTGKLLGKRGKKNNEDKKAKDISGIACTTDEGFPRAGLVIDDETQFAQFVIVNDGEIVAGETVRLIDDMFEGEPLELDGEGVAYCDGFFYVVGSHGHPRDKYTQLDPVRDRARIDALIAANSQLIRIQVDPATGRQTPGTSVQRSALLAKLIAADPTLAPFQHRRLDDNGVTIEGIAIHSRRLYVGFRGPSIDGPRAVILSAALGAFFDGSPAEATLHLLPLGAGRGVRDLAPFGEGLLILAGPTAEEAGDYSIYFWDRTAPHAVLLKDLLRYTNDDGKPIKPEAILPLDRTAERLRVLVMFDGAKEGAPRAIEMPSPDLSQ